MIEEIRAGVDPHTENAIAIFGADPTGDLKKFDKLRTIAKIVTFRLLYGGSAYGFFLDSKMPNYTLKKWNKIVEAFYNKYKILKEWQENNIRRVYRQGGILRNPTGRKFVFYKGEKGYKPSQIKNFPVQSLATADIMPLCMVLIYKKFVEKKFSSLFIGQVHDSLIFDCHKEEIKEIANMCIKIMENLPKYIKQYFGFEFDIPLTGGAECSKKSWGDMIKLQL
jgi:DNA polymerase-1